MPRKTSVISVVRLLLQCGQQKEPLCSGPFVGTWKNSAVDSQLLVTAFTHISNVIPHLSDPNPPPTQRRHNFPFPCRAINITVTITAGFLVSVPTGS